MFEKILQYFGFGRPTAEDPSQPDGAKAPASDEAPTPKSRAPHVARAPSPSSSLMSLVFSTGLTS